MNILLIGGLGNIGSPITWQLAEMGHSVYVLGRKKIEQLQPNIIYISGNTEDFNLLQSLQEQYAIDIVINFAIQTLTQAEVNINAFANRVKQFIFISTVTVLDREKKMSYSQKNLNVAILSVLMRRPS